MSPGSGRDTGLGVRCSYPHREKEWQDGPGYDNRGAGSTGTEADVSV